jgi:hypothetical protein
MATETSHLYVVEIKQGKNAPDGLLEGAEVVDEDEGRFLVQCTQELAESINREVHSGIGGLFEVPNGVTVEPITSLEQYDRAIGGDDGE